MNFSQSPMQGVEIMFKPKSIATQYIGPSQLGYVNINSPTSFEQVSNKIIQIFSPSKQSSAIFQNVAIISKKANKVLDVCQDKERKGMLIIYEDFKAPNQRFDIMKEGDYVQIVSKQNGKLLTVGGNSQKNGAPVFQEPLLGLVGQKFRLSALQNNEYLIHTFCGKVLDCCQERIANGTPVIQWKCDRKQHQIWLIS